MKITKKQLRKLIKETILAQVYEADEQFAPGPEEPDAEPEQSTSASDLTKRAKSMEKSKEISSMQPLEREIYNALDQIQAELAKPGLQIDATIKAKVEQLIALFTKKK